SPPPPDAELRFHPSPCPAIESDAAARIGTTVFRHHAKHAGVAVAVGHRQDAIDQAQAPDEKAVEDLAEPAEAVHRHHHAIDAPLQVLMLSIDMNLTLSILSNAGHLEQHLVN